MTTSRDALVAVLASADPGELLTWAQLEDLADAALAAGWASPAATAAAALLAAPLSDGAHGRPGQPAVTDTRAALRARHADYTKMRAAGDCARPTTRRLTGNPAGCGADMAPMQGNRRSSLVDCPVFVFSTRADRRFVSPAGGGRSHVGRVRHRQDRRSRPLRS